MNKLQKVWVWLSGKKTLLSSLVGFVYMILVWNGVIHYDQTVVDSIQAGVSLGLVHKLVKYIVKTS
jgi:hypothetical protein